MAFFAALSAVLDIVLILGARVFFGRTVRQAHTHYADTAATNDSLCTSGKRLVGCNLFLYHSVLWNYAQDTSRDISRRFVGAHLCMAGVYVSALAV